MGLKEIGELNVSEFLDDDRNSKELEELYESADLNELKDFAISKTSPELGEVA